MSQRSFVSVDKGWRKKRMQQMFTEFLPSSRHWLKCLERTLFHLFTLWSCKLESLIFLKLKLIEWKDAFLLPCSIIRFCWKMVLLNESWVSLGASNFNQIRRGLCSDLIVLYQINNFRWCPEHSWGSIENCNWSSGHCFIYRIISIYHLSLIYLSQSQKYNF